MAVRSGPGAFQMPVWAFAVIGFVLVVGLFFGIRGVASPDGGARGGGGSSAGGSTGTDTGTVGGGTGTTGGGDTTGGTTGGPSDGSPGGSTDGSWQTGGRDGGTNGGTNGNQGGDGDRDGGGNRGNGKPPGWLPWGPKSPNTDEVLEPDSAYDLLQRGECRQAYEAATDPGRQPDGSATPQSWKVIEGLAGICKAAQGERQGLDIAAKAEAGLRAAGYRPANTDQLCKDGDALAVLQRFVAYYQRHPAEQVVLRPAPAGAAACGNKISATDASVAPGSSIGFYGTWPDAPATVELRAAELTNPISLEPFGDEDDKARCCKDGTVSVDLPGADRFEGRRPTAIDVTLVTKSGATVTKRAAFTLDWSGVPQPPSPSSGSPASASPTSDALSR
ncbi:hypothetical protein ACH4D5_19990 [Streptomyces sp. NPDC018029]|uniref:hypothetical protein n=1 Tax=Streptomyces sp. NPDC018029 TaxID=3365032 RepID=UPI00378A889A